MDLNLVDPEDVPRPREEVRLRRLVVTPLADGRRLRVQVELTPFLERPNLDLAVIDATGESLARATIVEADSPSFSLTMHLRGEPQPGDFILRGELSYMSSPPQDIHEKHFMLEPSVDDRA